MKSKITISTVYALFVISGCASLIYEVLWVRLLTNTFGHTIYAVSTVLTAFMAGLALGSWLAGKYADRISRLIRLYGVIEIAIGIYAMVMYPLFLNLNFFYGKLYPLISSSFALLVMVRFVMAFLFLILPTALMGATVPIVIRALTRSFDRLGKRSGTLYAVNTTGAVLGTLLTAFYLIPTFGLKQTNMTAVGLNLLLGVVAFLLPIATPPPPTGETESVSPLKRLHWFALAAAAGAGFTSLAYEVVWTRSMVFSMFLGSTTYAFSTMLATFLLGIAGGSYVCSFFADRIKRKGFWFFLLQTSGGLLSILSLVLLYTYQLKTPDILEFSRGLRHDFLLAFGFMFLPTALLGAVFPLLIRAASRDRSLMGKDVSMVYAFNTLGAIFGSFAAGFILIPLLGMAGTFTLLCAFNLAIGIGFWIAVDRPTRGRVIRWVPLPVILLVLVFFITPGLNFKSYFTRVDHEICYYREGSSATITITQNPQGSKYLFVDSTYVQGANDMVADIDYKMQAHLPSLFHPHPETACTIGFGTGGTLFSYSRYPEYREINCVEIDRNIIRGAHCFEEANHGILNSGDERINIINEDIQSFLMNTDRQFDSISVDLTDISYKSSSALYTVDFLNLCREKLNPGGINTVWLSVKSMSPRSLKILLNSFVTAYPPEHVTLWHMTTFPNTDLLIVCVKDRPLSINMETMRQRMQIPEVKKDMDRLNISTPYKLLSCYLTSGVSIMDYLEGAPLHTIDRPILEFESPIDSNLVNTMGQNMGEIISQIRDPRPPVDVADDPAFQEEYLNYYMAREIFYQGELASLQWENYFAGIKFFTRAHYLVPGDASMLYSMRATDRQMDEFRNRLTGNPNDDNTRFLLAMAHILRREYDRASVCLPEPGRGQINPMFLYAHGLIAEHTGQTAMARDFYTSFLPYTSDIYRQEIETRIRALNLILDKRDMNYMDKAQLIDLFFSVGEVEKAMNLLDSIKDEALKDPRGKVWYAQVLQAVGKADEARAIYDQLIREDPANVRLLILRGDLFLLLREFDRASADYLHALELQGNDPYVHYQMARLCEITDIKDKARDYLDRAVQLGGERVRQRSLNDPILARLANQNQP